MIIWRMWRIYKNIKKNRRDIIVGMVLKKYDSQKVVMINEFIATFLLRNIGVCSATGKSYMNTRFLQKTKWNVFL